MGVAVTPTLGPHKGLLNKRWSVETGWQERTMTLEHLPCSGSMMLLILICGTISVMIKNPYGVPVHFHGHSNVWKRRVKALHRSSTVACRQYGHVSLCCYIPAKLLSSTLGGSHPFWIVAHCRYLRHNDVSLLLVQLVSIWLQTRSEV